MKNEHGGNDLRRLCWWYWQHRLIATKISGEQTSCGWHVVGTVSNDHMVWTFRSLPYRHAVGTVSNDHMIWTSRSLPCRHAVGTVSNDHMIWTSRSLPCRYAVGTVSNGTSHGPNLQKPAVPATSSGTFAASLGQYSAASEDPLC